MTLQTGPKQINAAFTLVELIVVMMLILVVIGTVAASLRGFFHGRNLDNEARQFLSLTRFGHSQAISQGLPVELWIDATHGRYGLQALSGYTQTDTNPIVYDVDKTVYLQVAQPSTLLTRSNYWTPQSTDIKMPGVVKIRFQPDGFISDNSPDHVYFKEENTGNQMWITESPNHMHYDLQTDIPATKGR